MEDQLLFTPVPRALETKNKIIGLELADVLILLINVSFQNLIFGGTWLKPAMVFSSSALLALLFFFVKRGRPDGYLGHALEHLLAASTIEANCPDEHHRRFVLEKTHE